jgi:hypothetical protein
MPRYSKAVLSPIWHIRHDSFTGEWATGFSLTTSHLDGLLHLGGVKAGEPEHTLPHAAVLQERLHIH